MDSHEPSADPQAAESLEHAGRMHGIDSVLAGMRGQPMTDETDVTVDGPFGPLTTSREHHVPPRSVRELTLSGGAGGNLDDRDQLSPPSLGA